MPKSQSKKNRQSRINDALYEIHRDISAPLSAKNLARTAAYSEQHFHRIFKETIGETVNTYIRRTRLEHAANQLMFDHDSSVLSIAEKCGFTSLSSFSRVFKIQFDTTPGKWRTIDRRYTEPPYLSDNEVNAGYQRVKNKEIPKPHVLKLNDFHVAYVRHQGYGRSIRNAWLLLNAWALQTGVTLNYSPLDQAPKAGLQIGLHHSNPEWVELADCRYVACMTIDKPLRKRGTINSFSVPGGIHIAFDLIGEYGDLLPYIGKIVKQWLPNSGYKLQTTPLFVHYEKNHFLDDDDAFKVRLFLPVSVL